MQLPVSGLGVKRLILFFEKFNSCLSILCHQTAYATRWQQHQDETEAEEMLRRQQKALKEKQTRRRQAELERAVRHELERAVRHIIRTCIKHDKVESTAQKNWTCGDVTTLSRA